MAKKDKIKERLSQRAPLGITKNNRLGKPAQRTELSMSSGSGAMEMYSQDTQYSYGPGTSVGHPFFLILKENACCNHLVPAPPLYVGIEQRIKSCHICT